MEECRQVVLCLIEEAERRRPNAIHKGVTSHKGLTLRIGHPLQCGIQSCRRSTPREMLSISMLSRSTAPPSRGSGGIAECSSGSLW